MGNLVDVLTIAESKIDSTFPNTQFQLPNFRLPYRLDVSERSGGLLTFVRKDILSRQLTDFIFPKDIQVIPIELNFRKQKWLLLSVYKPPRQPPVYFLEKLSEAIVYYSKFNNIIINGDINLEPSNPVLLHFLEINSFYNHMKEKTCWKSSKGSTIDFIISNKKHSLMNTGTFETGLSDHHLLIFTMLKTTHDRLPPKIMKYRQWKNFNENLFKNEISHIA